MSDCLFCGLMEKQVNVLFESEKVFAMLAPEPSVPGHIVVLPRKHSPILETVPDFVVGELFRVANKAGVAIFEALGAHGTNIIVQNGAPAGQRHHHAMVHVVPRFENDGLQIGWNPKPADEAELSKLEKAIRDETKNVGVFEREKPKPLELPKPSEVKEEDQRLKSLRRIP